MNILSNLKPAKGSVKKEKRVGRGPGSGHGGTSCRGMNGQRSRSGGERFRPNFEGGQMPLARRVPKRGFKSPLRVEYQALKLQRLVDFVLKNNLSDQKITPELLYEKKAVGSKNKPIKILGDGDVNFKLDLTIHAISQSARQKIESAGGIINIVKF
ncbi:MAG: 50S ribosomal protein L15 [Ignavibacteria bacterium]|jgi:large subunit ribosomal protein L15|nr:50S ribosomal protein L15 [Ignavibacteria bacterium]MDH7528043.1 50S ribosomal protein L15 [Ignavibacteria bacterium]